MASSKDFFSFVMDQLRDVEGISTRRMMGEYIIYLHGVVVGGIYDDRVLFKDTIGGRKLLDEPDLESPYDGAKPMIMVNPDDRELLEAMVKETYKALEKTR